MEHFTDIILKLIDRFPTWYLMIVVSITIFYKMINKMCKDNHLLIAKILAKWKVKNDVVEKNINIKLDSLENKIKKNTDSINDIYDLLKNKE